VTDEWAVAGSYFEACSCLPICPCRQVGQRQGGRSSFGVCVFALSWLITAGHRGDEDLSGLSTVMVGSYDDDQPGSPWTVSLYVDEAANAAQQDHLADIFLGRAGGTPRRNYAGAITTVSAVEPARIRLDHRHRHWSIRVDERVEVAAEEEVPSPEPVACGIPGLDRPGQELRSRTLRLASAPLSWEWTDRCGFTTSFDYRSER
jgi:hypothetical protein